MRRFPLFVSLVVLLAPASASAAPFGELPLSSTGEGATCLRATGAPGELVRSSRTGARFLQVGTTGLTESGSVLTGTPQGECPQVAARAGGAGVIAQSGSGLWVATRDPGGAWTKPARLAPDASRAAVAVADSGAAVVAWLEPGEEGRFAVKAMRRAAGGAFGPAATLGSARSSSEYFIQGTVRAAIAADGEAVVLWTQPPPDDDTLRMPVQAAIAPAGGAFGAAQRLGETFTASAPVLSAAPDGRALAAFWTGKEVQVAERTPGGPFAAASTVARVSDPYTLMPAVEVGSGGAAVVGWYGLFSQGVSAVARAGAGPFGPAVPLAAAAGVPGLSDATLALLTAFGLGLYGPVGVEGVSPDSEGGNLRAALTPDGRAFLTWNSLVAIPRVATFPLAGGHVDRFPVGAGVREASSIAPLITAGGTPAIAWSDNDSEARTGDGRVHVAVEGFAAAPDAPAPSVELGRPLRTLLRPEASLSLPVSCSAACEVRVDLPDRFASGTMMSLASAGRRVLKIEPALEPIAPARRGPVRVRVRVSSPGAHSAVERIETITLERVRVPPPPKLSAVKAVRHGSRVDVSWRTDRNASPDAFLVVGSSNRSTLGIDDLVPGEAKRAGPRRFTSRLTGAKNVRFVFVFVASDASLAAPVIVRVR